MHAWLRNALSRKSFVENSAHLQAWRIGTAPPSRNVLGDDGKYGEMERAMGIEPTS